ncbi:MAG: synthase subunit gamma, partial [Evtepia sp.]|nr:synthase subunit gamma [Evtepia sp.]
MAGIKEIRNHIKSVEATLKITNAMYLIASSSLRKARKQLTDVKPYFNKLSYTIADILHHSPNIIHPYFDQRPKIGPEDRKIGYIVVTGDKGLAGAYNHNVLKLAEEQIKGKKNSVLFLIGHMGRSWFSGKNVHVDPDFLYSAQNPTIAEAREMTATLLSQYQEGQLDEVWVIYTHMVNPLLLQPTCLKLLPLERDLFPWEPRTEESQPRTVNYVPSEEMVLDGLVP